MITLVIIGYFIFQELQASANLLVQARAGLLSGLDEQKAVADSEARERSSILGKFRNMEHMVNTCNSPGVNYPCLIFRVSARV